MEYLIAFALGFAEGEQRIEVDSSFVHVVLCHVISRRLNLVQKAVCFRYGYDYIAND